MVDRKVTVVQTDAVTVTMPEHLAIPEQEYKKRMMPYLTMALDHLKGEVRERMPSGAGSYASRGLKQSVFRKIEEKPESVEGTVYVPLGIPAGQYAYFVEYGRRAGKMPPFSEGSALHSWVKVKYESGGFGRGKERVGKKTTVGEKAEIGQLAFLIARKIAIKGTPAQHPFELGFAAALPTVKLIIEQGSQTVNE